MSILLHGSVKCCSLALAWEMLSQGSDPKWYLQVFMVMKDSIAIAWHSTKTSQSRCHQTDVLHRVHVFHQIWVFVNPGIRFVSDHNYGSLIFLIADYLSCPPQKIRRPMSTLGLIINDTSPFIRFSTGNPCGQVSSLKSQGRERPIRFKMSSDSYVFMIYVMRCAFDTNRGHQTTYRTQGSEISNDQSFTP